jgi:hypothetical protein
MYWRIGRAIRENPGEENKAAFRNVVRCGPRPGLLAFDGGMVLAHAACRAARAEIAPGGASGWMMSAGNFDRTSAAARPLGVEIQATKRRLDEGFASGFIGPDMLRAETAAIAELQGKGCLVLREPPTVVRRFFAVCACRRFQPFGGSQGNRWVRP